MAAFAHSGQKAAVPDTTTLRTFPQALRDDLPRRTHHHNSAFSNCAGFCSAGPGNPISFQRNGKYMRVRRFILGCLALTLSVSSAAQTISWGVNAAPDHANGCELHIFPAQAPEVNDNTQSSFKGLVPDLMNSWFSVKNPAALQQFMATAAPASFQVEFLRGIDYSNTAKGLHRAVIIHELPVPDLTRKDIKEFLKDIKLKPRNVPNSSSRCYEEIVLTVPNYTKFTMSSSVKNGFVYRRFDGDVPTYAEFGAYGRPVPNFPPKNSEQLASAVDGLRAVYRENIMRILNENNLRKLNEKSWGKIN